MPARHNVTDVTGEAERDLHEIQVDNGGAWGEIRFDLTERTAWVEAFAENDPCGTWTVTDQVIRAILMCENEKLPKKY